MTLPRPVRRITQLAFVALALFLASGTITGARIVASTAADADFDNVPDSIDACPFVAAATPDGCPVEAPMNGNFDGANKVGSLHDMRFVFLDNDTKLLFCTAFDGEWDPYIDDFATKIPDYLDILDCALEGWPGIRSPEAKDYLASHQINAEGWYVAHPDLTVAEISRLKRVGEAVDEFLDKIGD